jgi:hypothetical protein
MACIDKTPKLKASMIFRLLHTKELCFKCYKQVKILDYYSKYPPPCCIMDNSYTIAVQLAMFKAKGQKYLDAMEMGANALNRQQNEE